jgi:hypothetical protein
MKIIRPVDVDDSVFQSSDVPEADYAAWAGGTTYADEDRVIVTTGYHKIYESQQAANTGNDPTTDDGTWWVEVSSTNRWKMFNAIVQEQTVQASEINTVLQSSTVVNSVALINLDATTVQITVTDSVEGLVYDETYTMTSYSGIQDWYAYFFEPIIRDTQLAVTDLPPYANADIGVTISSSGDAKCGALVIGQFAVLGLSQHGVSLSIVDYSTKTTDAARQCHDHRWSIFRQNGSRCSAGYSSNRAGKKDAHIFANESFSMGSPGQSIGFGNLWLLSRI